MSSNDKEMTDNEPKDDSKVSVPANAPQKEDMRSAQLGTLEEDDEFEEFQAEDWTDADTELGAKVAAAVAAGGGSMPNEGSIEDHLWKDDWDDDDVEDDFSKQLKDELEKKG